MRMSYENFIKHNKIYLRFIKSIKLEVCQTLRYIKILNNHRLYGPYIYYYNTCTNTSKLKLCRLFK